MTKNLQKAIVGDVMCVIDPNITGYGKLKNLNYDDRLMKDVINGIGQTLADVINENKLQDDKLLGLKNENEALRLEIANVKNDVLKLRKIIEETLKGLMLR